MAAELQYRHTATGSTMRATVRKEQTTGGKAQMWNGSAWEDMTVANWANYLVTLTETPASSYVYIGTMPAVVAGWYYVDIYSGTAISSTLEATLFGYWDTTNLFLGGADTRQVAGTVQTARDIGASVLLSSGTGTGQISLSSGAVTVGTNNDKTGYTASTVSDKTGYSLTATTGLGNQTANITGNLSGSVGSVTGAVGSVTGAVGSVTGAVGSISGVTFPTNFADLNISATTGLVRPDMANASGNYAGTVAVVTTLTNLPAITTNWLTAAGIAADAGAEIADAVWDEAISGHLGAGSTGAALNAAGSAGDPWSTPLPGAYGAGTAGKIIGDNINAPIGTVDTVVDGIATTLGAAGAGLTALASAANLATVAGYLDTEVAAILAAVDTEVAAIKTVTDAIGATGTGLSAIPWNAAWDAEVQSECTDALNAYDPPTNAEMEARTLVAAGYATAADQTSILGYVDCLPASWVTVPTAAENADALLGRNIAGGSSTGRTVKQALATLRNKFTVSSGTLTVYDTDDTTPLYTSTLTSDAAAEPITGSDPT